MSNYQIREAIESAKKYFSEPPRGPLLPWTGGSGRHVRLRDSIFGQVAGLPENAPYRAAPPLTAGVGPGSAYPPRMGDLDARGAALEYWFFKFNIDGLAFLVDFIVRRPKEQAEVRISSWVDGRGRVDHACFPTWDTSAPFVEIGPNRLGSDSTRGAVADIGWDLTYDAGPETVNPVVAPLRWLRPSDLQIINRPDARFSGTVTIAGRTVSVRQTRGLVSHYWGRRLWDQWWWISVNRFDDPEVAVEAALAQSRFWGMPGASVKLGYLWLRTATSSHTVISPLNGLIRVTGQPDDFTLTARSITGRTVRLVCTAPAGAYNNLGQGIHQTLLGSCTIEGVATATETAGLEYRSLARAGP